MYGGRVQRYSKLRNLDRIDMFMRNRLFFGPKALSNAFLKRKVSSTSSSKGGNGGLWGKYMELLERRPLETKIVTSGVLAFASDVICQKIDREYISKDDKKHDWIRTARFTSLGAFYMAPILHMWYGFLMRSFSGTGALVTIQRVALDQCIFAPVYLSGLFSCDMVLEGKADKVEAKLRADLLPTVMANFSVWVPVMFVGFKFVPANLQVQYSNVIGFFWNIYLSFRLAKVVPSETQAQQGKNH